VCVFIGFKKEPLGMEGRPLVIQVPIHGGRQFIGVGFIDVVVLVVAIILSRSSLIKRASSERSRCVCLALKKKIRLVFGRSLKAMRSGKSVAKRRRKSTRRNRAS